MTFVALLTFLPEALGSKALGQSLPLISLLGTFGAGWLARMIAPDRIAMAGFALAILTTMLMWLGQGWAVYPLFLALGIIPGGSFASIPYFNGSTADRARSTGAIAQMGNVGTTSGTPIFAVLLSLGGLGGIYAGIVLFSIFGIAGLFIMRRLVTRQS